MSEGSIKKLAGQTMWYGVSSVAARSIAFLLTRFITGATTTEEYGQFTAVYSMIPLFNIIFTYGMETAYFRFIQKREHAETVNNVATISLLVSTAFFSLLLWNSQSWLAKISSLPDLPELIQLSIFVIGLDALCTIPFARLRNEGRPRMFAFVKIAGIFIYIGLAVFFLGYCPNHVDNNSWLQLVYSKDTNPVTYLLIANMVQSAFTLLILWKRVFPKKWNFDFSLWKEMMLYALPMLLAGLGGTINDTFDRLMLGWWLPADYNIDIERGNYGACTKLAILISLFVQAFRMGAEPFFFKQSQGSNPQKVYARVMKFFVITITLMFLAVSLFIPIWRHFLNPKYWGYLGIVPVLLLANMSLGIYYNLSVWYKVSNRTMAGAWITLIGTAITLTLNYFLIPVISYVGCAWATFICYLTMMIISFVWGQKEYYIPYAWKKLCAYLLIVIILFFIHKGINALCNDNVIISLISAVLLTSAYMWFVFMIEKKEFMQMIKKKK